MSLASGLTVPFGRRPCSNRYLRIDSVRPQFDCVLGGPLRGFGWTYSSQALLPSWIPACPVVERFRLSPSMRALGGRRGVSINYLYGGGESIQKATISSIQF